MPDEIDEGALEAAVNASYGVWQAWQGIDAHNVSDVRRDAMRSALLAYEAAKAGDAGAVAGWKMVPMEPTEAMLNAPQMRDWAWRNEDAVMPVEIADCYRQMLAASPTPPAPAAPAGDLGWHPRDSGQKP